MTITDKCACGATITVSGNEAATMISVGQWRRDHPCTIREAQSQDTRGE